MRSPRSPAERTREQRGSAVVDFVLVSLILVPLVLGIIQVALVMYVRTTLAAAATEGARYAATVDRDPAAGVDRTRQQIDGALAARFASGVTAREEQVGGLRTVVVRVHAVVPALGLWGPAVGIDVAGHGVEEFP
jgi:Flp pilus assembly protein TadG